MTYDITLIPGDGVGPEVTEAAKRVLDATGVDLQWEVAYAGANAREKFGDLLPDATLQSIRKNKMKHRPDEYIICVDSKSWRKKVFPYYKAKREQMRKERGHDFKFFVENMEGFIADLERHFPYKVVKIGGAEADDIIAVLAQHLAPKRGKVIIASNDKDFRQLVRDNVILWSMRDEKFANVDDPHEFLMCHLLQGDSGDGIPNVRSDDDTFIVDGKRQKPCGPKTVDKILQQGIDEWLDEQGLRRNWNRNKKLIALDSNSIPRKLWEVVVAKYDSLEQKKGNYQRVLHYMARNDMRGLMKDVAAFM